MARFPCDGCDKRIVGKAVYMYPSVYLEDEQYGSRKRLCDACAKESLQGLGRRLLDNVLDGCAVKGCKNGKSASAAGFAYATIYDRASERTDVGGPVCADDLALVAAMMRVDLPQRG